MAYRFTHNGSTRIAFGSSQALFPDVVTIMFWLYATTLDTTYQAIIERTPSDFSDYRGVGINDSSGGLVGFIRRGSPAFTGIDVSAAGIITANKWYFGAVQMDATTASASSQKIFVGDALAPAAEVSSYGAQDPGSGATSSPASEPLVIGNNSTLAEGFPGLLSHVAIVGRLLSLREIVEYQYYPHRQAGCVFYAPLDTPGLQFDHASLSHGTATGAVFASGNQPPVLYAPNHRLFDYDIAQGGAASPARRIFVIS